jgi:diguanylate cyclase (GGDEF)-like protein
MIDGANNEIPKNDSRQRRGLNPDWNKGATSPEAADNVVLRSEAYLKAVDKLYAHLAQLKEEGLVDTLTKCWNSRYFDQIATTEFDQNRDSGQIGIIYMDLNNLKQVNDHPEYGYHRGGDQLISNFVAYIKSHLRKGDEMVRIGGDEFIVLCHPGEQDDQFAQNLKNSMQTIHEEAPKSSDLAKNISFAYGVAVYDKELDKDLYATRNRADELIMEHKNLMKNSAT